MSKSKIWLHFVKLGRTNGFKQNRTRCKYCNYELNHAVGRRELHLKKCSSVPVSVLQSLFSPNFSQDTNHHHHHHHHHHQLVQFQLIHTVDDIDLITWRKGIFSSAAPELAKFAVHII